MLKLKRIDELGAVKASIAELEARAKFLTDMIKRDMISNGVREAEGDLFRTTYSVAERVSVDSAIVKSLYPIDTNPELYKSTVTETIRVTSRNSQLLAA